eukprot:5321831-Prymnesium_polylepis.1
MPDGASEQLRHATHPSCNRLTDKARVVHHILSMASVIESATCANWRSCRARRQGTATKVGALTASVMFAWTGANCEAWLAIRREAAR